MDLITIAEKACALAQAFPKSAQNFTDSKDALRRHELIPQANLSPAESLKVLARRRMRLRRCDKAYRSLHNELGKLALACIQQLPELSQLTWVRTNPTWISQASPDWPAITAELRLIEDWARAKATSQPLPTTEKDKRAKFCFDEWQRGQGYKEINTALKKSTWDHYEDARSVRRAIHAWAKIAGVTPRIGHAGAPPKSGTKPKLPKRGKSTRALSSRTNSR